MSGKMFRAVLVIALCSVCMGVLVVADQSSLSINETNGGFLLRKNVLIHPVIMNGTSMHKNSNQTNSTGILIQLNPLGNVPLLVNTSAIKESEKIKTEEETTFLNQYISSADNSSPSSPIAAKFASESEWVPFETTESGSTSENVPEASTESELIETKTSRSSNTPTLVEEISTEPELNTIEPSKNNNSHSTSPSDIVQESTFIPTGENTVIVSLSTSNANTTVETTQSSFQTELTDATEIITNYSETTVNDSASSETVSVSEAIIETSTLSTTDITASASPSPTSEATEYIPSTSKLPMTSSSGQEDSTSPPSKTEPPIRSSSVTQSTVSIYSSSDVPKHVTTSEEEKSSPTSETKDKTDVESSSSTMTSVTDTSGVTENTTPHMRTVKNKSITTLKLALSFTFLAISLVAMAVLLAYLVKMKKRGIPYEELSLYP